MNYEQQTQQTPPPRPVNVTRSMDPGLFKRHRGAWIAALLVVVALCILLPECLYTVGESEQAVISRFGVITDVIVSPRNDFHARYPNVYASEKIPLETVNVRYGRGLRVKLPFVDKVEKFTDRLLTYVSDSEIVNTSEKKQYYITTYAQWAIMDPALFSLAFGSPTRADSYLDNLIHPVVVQSINRLTAESFVSDKGALNAALELGLRQINDDVRTSGIEIVDLQIHRTILPQANLESTYARMAADREKVAQQLRSEGDEAYQMAVSGVDLEGRRIEAEATSEAGAIRGGGDAQALEIYARAYGMDEEFYTFWRSLQALEKGLSNGTTLVIDPTHPLWKSLVEWGILGE